MTKTISRREFLKGSAAGVVGVALSSFIGGGVTALASDDIPADVIPESTVTLNVYDQLANYSGEQIGWFGQIMLEKFNVKLNIIDDQDGVYESRMESGDLGDIVIWGSDGDEYLEAVNQGLLFDWEDEDLLSEYGPYILEHMEPALEKNRNLSGGTIYGYGFDVAVDADDTQDAMYTWDLRWDLYAQLGYPEINNLDDLLEVLIQMKELCPTDDNGNATYAMSIFPDWDGDMVMYVKSLATAYYGYDEFGIGLYDPENGVYHNALEEDGPYLTTLRFYNKLYQNGLLNPDSMTQTYDNACEDYQNGGAFFNIFNFLGESMYNTDAHMADKEDGSMGGALYPRVPNEARPIIYGQTIYGGNRIWSIGENTEYPELCMAILNWLSTPEGRLTFEYGPQDVCWYYDEEGYLYLTELGASCKADVNTEMSDGYSGTFDDGSFKMNNTTWALDTINLDSPVGETYNYQKWASQQTEASTLVEADWREWSGCTTFDAYVKTSDYMLSPGTDYSTSAKSDELQTTWSQVTNCIKNGSWNAIYADSDEAFDEIVAQMTTDAYDYGFDECIEFQENEATLRHEAEERALAGE
ncbi:MAG: twin-arginine translocation signal domain-containing protein [Lachnospiraceae bacterium]|nr:twin-arginine translocation signal domain-containing protein [Lachnospiraceae bacterium]